MFTIIGLSFVLCALVGVSVQIKTVHEIYNYGSCSVTLGSASGNQNGILEIPSLLPDSCATNILDFSLTTTEVCARSSTEYVAGVVEYYPSMNINAEKRLQTNINRYLWFIEDAKKQDVDILVFPESTLNSVIGDRGALTKSSTFIPEPIEHEVPCNNRYSPGGAYDQVLVPLSCAAKNKKMYIVINVSEKESCTPASQAQNNDTRPCHADSLNFYNTNVVFDRTGAVVARYRKYNLFGERNFNATKTAEHVTFDTDFGVRFGLFTCFDIMFNEPTLGLVRDGVKDFVFPTMWFSELPFLTALQVQEYWAHTNDVNLLASGASNTKVGSGGSGIYAGVKGPLVNYISIPGHDNDKLLVARVPKLKGTLQKSPTDIVKRAVNYQPKKEHNMDEHNMDEFYMKRDMIDDFTSELVGAKFSRKLCSGELCCTFNVTSEFLNRVPGKDSYWYRAIVGNIIRSFSGVANGGIKACAVIACSGPDFKSCARRYPFSSDVVPHQLFHSILIEGDFPAIDEVLTLPTTLRHAMRPLKAGSINYNEERRANDGKKHVTISLRGLPVIDLQTFGIYGRDFRGDGAGPAQLTDFTYFQYNVLQTL